jgi:phosphohistidine phosphatase
MFSRQIELLYICRMKRIYFTRHGKSAWNDLTLNDHDRPLKKRGRQDALIIANEMLDLVHRPQMIFSSSAQRAKETALIFKETLGIPFIQYFIDLYHADDEKILEFIQLLEVDYQTVQFFGHNPGYTDMLNRFSPNSISNLPTSGTFFVQFDCNKWEEVDWMNGRLEGHWFPRDYK